MPGDEAAEGAPGEQGARLAEVREAARRRWQDKYESWAEDRVAMVVQLTSAERMKEQLEPREALRRLQDHNTTVAALLRAVGQESGAGEWASVLRPLQHGVLVVADHHYIHHCVALAWRVIDHFDREAGLDAPVLALRSTVGIALGEVVVVPPSVIETGDVIGPAVDLALRLVRENGKPGQILLEHAAYVATKAGAVKDLLPYGADSVTLDFVPANGTKQRLRGVRTDVQVRQLRWREDLPPIVNRRVLTEELLRVQRGALTVMTRINELNLDYRAALSTKNLDQIIEFHREVAALADDEDDDAEITALRTALDHTMETEHEVRLRRACARVVETHGGATAALAGARQARREGETAFDEAIRTVRDRWSEFERACKRLLEITQTRIDELHRNV